MKSDGRDNGTVSRVAQLVRAAGTNLQVGGSIPPTATITFLLTKNKRL